MSEKNRERASLVRRMIASVLLGLFVGTLLMLFRNHLRESGNAAVWDMVYAVFFADVMQGSTLDSLGLFFLVGQLFMHGLQLAIVPLVFFSLSLAVASLASPEKLGKVAGKTFLAYLAFYAVAAALSALAAYGVKETGLFTVDLPAEAVVPIAEMEGVNPLATLVTAVPPNLFSALSSNNSVLSVVVVAVIMGISMTAMGERARTLRTVCENMNDIVQMWLAFLIERAAPVAIFCMIVRALAIYGTEYVRPTLVWMVVTIVVSLVLVTTIYPFGILIFARISPIPFMKKIFKVALFAAATNSSAATLPINTKTCTKELGCSKEISSFILPTGMTINMNGTTAMHMVAITFIGTAAGIDVTPATLVLAAFLSVCTAVGTPAIPIAGTTMVYVVMTGLGMNSDACMIGYSLVLAMNYLPGMAVITLNVVGDAATNVIISAREGELDRARYYG